MRLKWRCPQFIVPDGALEALKWIALLLMTADHINKYIFNGTNNFIFNAGRTAMPIFVTVFAYNLARPGSFESGAYTRIMQRLILFGLLAMPAIFFMAGIAASWRPLNILFTLFGIAVTVYLMAQRNTFCYITGTVVFFVVGTNVEFWWPALTLGLAVWWYCTRPSFMPLLLALMALCALWFINGNMWALAALPIILAVKLLRLSMPRQRWLFYAYYPLHLWALVPIRYFMEKAGYLYF